MNANKIGLKLCRLCGKEKPRATDVFKDKIKGAVLVSIINKYFPKEVINMSITDSFSKHVCMDCEHKICTFDEFCLMVANVQKELSAPTLEIDFAEDMLCHLKENEFSVIEKNPDDSVRTSKKIIVCEQCSKSFRCQAHLKRHKRIHTGQRPFVCNICSKSFNQRDILNIHKKSHEERNEFKCENCLQSFRYKVSLKSHMLTFHADVNDSAITDLQFNKSLSCPECGKVFATKYKFQRHIRCHTGEKPFTCNFCNRSFSQTGNLKLHLTKCSRQQHENVINPILQETVKVLESTDLAEATLLAAERHPTLEDNLLDQTSSLTNNTASHIEANTDCTASLEHFPSPPAYISETEIQNTINETFNSTSNVDPCASSYLYRSYIDADEIETILERDLQHLVDEPSTTSTPTSSSNVALGNKYSTDLQEKIPLCIKQPETPELFHSLLYDV